MMKLAFAGAALSLVGNSHGATIMALTSRRRPRHDDEHLPFFETPSAAKTNDRPLTQTSHLQGN